MKTKGKNVLPKLRVYIQESVREFNSINVERKELLVKLAEYISNKLRNKELANLTFICTHNSRRSHISQLWAQAAAYYFGIPNIFCFSAGTEATAFNPRAVKAMQNAGFSIVKNNDSSNPRYSVTISENFPPSIAFSKTISDSFNPQKDFAAIMTCDNADEACPIVPGADARFPIKYEDPKIADDTDEEEAKYNERCRQISIEMLFLFSKVNL